MEQKPVTLTTVIIASVVTAILTGGVCVAMRQELQEQMLSTALAQQDANEKLSRKVSALEAQIGELSARPTTDTATIDGLRSELGSAKTTIGELNERIATLEKKPEPVATSVTVATATTTLSALKSAVLAGSVYEAELDIWEKEHPKSGKRVAKLRDYADNGLPTEESLRAELRKLLTQSDETSSAFPEKSLVARINTHLPGLVTIKKKSSLAPELKTLREGMNDVSLDVLKSQVMSLPDTQKAAFAGWLKTAEGRAAALTELNALEGTK